MASSLSTTAQSLEPFLACATSQQAHFDGTIALQERGHENTPSRPPGRQKRRKLPGGATFSASRRAAALTRRSCRSGGSVKKRPLTNRNMQHACPRLHTLAH